MTTEQEPKGELKEYGFQMPVLQVSDHIFGAGVGGAIINPSGQYDIAKPQYEPQADKFETQGCTVWGTENALEFLHIFKFDVEKNYEELPPYIGAGIRPELGGDPNTVAQWIRENGLVEVPQFPFPKTLQELLALLTKELPQNIVSEGEKWLQEHEMRHQWVLQGASTKAERLDAIKGALQYGVVGVSVTAWFQDSEGLYVDNGQRNTHWCVCYGWTDKGWKIFDSYDHSEKIYSFDSVISFAKVYFLDKRQTTEQKASIWKVIKAFLFGHPEEIKKLEPLLNPEPPKPVTETPAEKLKRLCIESVGKDLSQLAPDELGCADSVSNLLKQIFPDFPPLISTVSLKLHLDMDKRFKRVEKQVWSVIVSPTEKKKIGHTGVLGEGGAIYSNNSDTGLWSAHWTIDEWYRYYKMKSGLKVYFYRIIS